MSEVARLEVGDIDAKRMVLHIRDAKRGGERYVMLSPRLLSALLAYWKNESPCLFAPSEFLPVFGNFPHPSYRQCPRLLLIIGWTGS